MSFTAWARPAGRYAVRDEYARSDAAPLASPVATRSGQRIAVQNDGSFAESGGSLVVTPQATPTYGDLQLRYPVTTRAARRPLAARITASAGRIEIGYWKGTSFTAANRSSVLAVEETGGAIALGRPAGDLVAFGNPMDVAVVPRSTAGSFYLGRVPEFGGPWTLLVVDWAGSDATLHPGISCYDFDGSLAWLRSRYAPFEPATLVSAAPAALDTTYTACRSPLFDLAITLAGSLTNGHELRVQCNYLDADNHVDWRVWYDGSHVRQVIAEVVDGVETEISVPIQTAWTAGSTVYLQGLAGVGGSHAAMLRSTEAGDNTDRVGGDASGPQAYDTATGLRVTRTGGSFSAGRLYAWNTIPGLARSTG